MLFTILYICLKIDWEDTSPPTVQWEHKAKVHHRQRRHSAEEAPQNHWTLQPVRKTQAHQKTGNGITAAGRIILGTDKVQAQLLPLLFCIGLPSEQTRSHQFRPCHQ